MDYQIIGGATPNGRIGGGTGSGIFDGYHMRESAGIFGNPYSDNWYEQQEPRAGWAVERWPGKPFTGGRAHRGHVMVGPAMGTFDIRSLWVPAVGIAVAGAVVALGFWLHEKYVG